jgi:hypothetical protein
MLLAGIDADLKYVEIAVLDRLGKVTLETRVPTGAQAKVGELAMKLEVAQGIAPKGLRGGVQEALQARASVSGNGSARRTDDGLRGPSCGSLERYTRLLRERLSASSCLAVSSLRQFAISPRQRC